MQSVLGDNISWQKTVFIVKRRVNHSEAQQQMGYITRRNRQRRFNFGNGTSFPSRKPHHWHIQQVRGHTPFNLCLVLCTSNRFGRHDLTASEQRNRDDEATSEQIIRDLAWRVSDNGSRDVPLCLASTLVLTLPSRFNVQRDTTKQFGLNAQR